MNKLTDIILWLAERVTEPSCVDLWLLVGGNKPYNMSLFLAKKWKNRHILGVLLGLNVPLCDSMAAIWRE